MIHIVGDSHSCYEFHDINGVVSHYLGSVTLKRVGYAEDDAIRVEGSESYTLDDVVLFSFGDIDVRHHIQNQVRAAARWMKDTGRTQPVDPLEAVFDMLVTRFIERMLDFRACGKFGRARLGIVSIIPPYRVDPMKAKRGCKSKWRDIVGTDAERASYAIALNSRFKAACETNDFLYLDVHAQSADAWGLMVPALSADMVHVTSSECAKRALRAIGL